MRVEPYAIDSIVHVVKRGARGLPIVRDNLDSVRFSRLLLHLNDEYRSDFWEEDTKRMAPYERPRHWPNRDPLVQVLAWTLMPNHFHLLIREIKEGGISRFMQSVSGSMSRHFNEKYDERGSLFQGSYRSRTIDSDQYLRYVAAYVMSKNVLEMYPGKIHTIDKFDAAWQWALHKYPHSSFPVYAGNKYSSIVDSQYLKGVLGSKNEFRTFSRDLILGRLKIDDTYNDPHFY